MKKASSFFAFLIILLIAAGACFYIGYSPLKLKHDTVGVVVSKTSGVIEKPVERGVFQWNWQFLIPTNAKLRTFSLKPFTYKVVKSGIFPSGDVYSKQLKEVPDFSYSLTFNVELSCSGKDCVELVKNSAIATDSELQQRLAVLSEEIVEKVFDAFMKQVENGQAIDFEKAESDVISEYSKKNVKVAMVSVTDRKLPDVELYNTTKKMYVEYLAKVERSLNSYAETQAKEISDYTKNLNKLEKFGKVLKDHPELAEFLKSSKDMNETLKTIYSFQ